MSYADSFGHAVLITAPAECTAGPLRDGGDVSWLSRCRVGDNQGNDGACAIFTMANWAEVMFGTEIGDHACLALYRAALKRFGRQPGSGLTFGEAYMLASEAGWLPNTKGLMRTLTLAAIECQPILAAYRVTPAWERPNRAGCLDHTSTDAVRGYHAVLIAAHGSMPPSPERLVYIENSWGLGWGWNGIGVMTEALHRRLNVEMWEILI
jgi:hypothetical protein